MMNYSGGAGTGFFTLKGGETFDTKAYYETD